MFQQLGPGCEMFTAVFMMVVEFKANLSNARTQSRREKLETQITTIFNSTTTNGKNLLCLKINIFFLQSRVSLNCRRVISLTQFFPVGDTRVCRERCVGGSGPARRGPYCQS